MLLRPTDKRNARVSPPGNRFPDLIELKLAIKSKPDFDQKREELRVSLRVHCTEIQADQAVCRVQIRRASLRLDPQGFEIVEGTQTNEPTRPNEIIEKVSTQNQTTTTAKGSVSLKGGTGGPLNPFSASGEASVSADHSSTEKSETTRDIVHRCISARPNHAWEITEPQDALLGGSYLVDAAICDLVAKAKSNRQCVVGAIVVRQRDLQIDVVDGQKWFNRNKESVKNIIIAKSMHEQSSPRGDSYKGALVLSKIETGPDHEE
jgi:hypothetical protein